MGDVVAFVASGADGSRRVPMLLQLGARATSSEIGVVVGLTAAAPPPPEELLKTERTS